MIVSRNSQRDRFCLVYLAISLCAVVLVGTPVAAQDRAHSNVEPVKPTEALSSQTRVPTQLSQPLAPARVLAPSSLEPDSAAELSPAMQPDSGILNPQGLSSNDNDPSTATARGGSIAPPPPGGLSPIGINVEELRQLDPDSLGTLKIEEGGFGILMGRVAPPQN